MLAIVSYICSDILMMKVKTITYQRVKNLGNYESKRFEMTAEINDDEDVETAIATLKAIVNKALNIVEDDRPPF
jgi:small-conductance mechanosensitive channel